MRELKFRAFSEVDQVMFNVYTITWGVHYENGTVRNGKNKYFLSEVDLMQYAGLKDCSGKDIYEGDIMSDLPKSTALYVVKESTGGFYAHRIVFENDMQDGTVLTYFLPPTREEKCLRLRVIGNIHENPELLKESI